MFGNSHDPSDGCVREGEIEYLIFGRESDYDNITAGAEDYAQYEDEGWEYEDFLRDRLEEVGMSKYLKRRVRNLSGGQKQKVALARALMCDPSVVLCDEPTGALDSASSEEILKLLLKVKEQGTTVIVVTHNMMFENYSDRNIHIKDGHICEA